MMCSVSRWMVALLVTVPSLARADSSMMVVLPDTQTYVEYKRSTLSNMFNWIVSNRDASNIFFVGHVGDVINDYANPASAPEQWAYATNEYAKLDAAAIPYAMVPGNHDYAQGTRDSSLMNSFFPLTTFTNMPSFGGAFDGHSDNTYHLFQIQGRDWLVLSLEFGPRSEVLAWANGVLASFADRLAVVITHAYLNKNGERFVHADNHAASNGYGLGSGPPEVYDGADMWQNLIYSNQQVRLVISGHDGDTNIGARLKIGTNISGRAVCEVLNNYQYFNSPSYPGFMLLLEFLSDGSASFKAYSPTLNLTATNAGSFGTLDLDTSVSSNVSFAATSAEVGEESGSYEVRVNKTWPGDLVNVQLTLGGSATAGAAGDYTLSSTNLALDGATTSVVVTLTLVDDAAVEGSETVVLTLTNATGATLANPSTFTLTILDDDEAPPPPPGADLLSFRFNTMPYLGVSSNSPHLTVSNVTLSTTGTIETAQMVATYNFPDLPYIQARYGWTASSQAGAKAFRFTLVPEAGYQVTITNISFLAYANNAGPSVFGYDMGGLATAESNAPDQRLVEVRRSVSGVQNITNPLTVLIQGWTNGSRATDGTGYMRLDDLVLQGFVEPTAPDPDQDADGIPDAREDDWCGGDCDPAATPPGGSHTYLELYILDSTPADTNAFTLSLALDPLAMKLQFLATNSRTYAVEYRDSLAPAGEDWTPVAAPCLGSNGLHTVADPHPVAFRSYRARVLVE